MHLVPQDWRFGRFGLVCLVFAVAEACGGGGRGDGGGGTDAGGAGTADAAGNVATGGLASGNASGGSSTPGGGSTSNAGSSPEAGAGDPGTKPALLDPLIFGDTASETAHACKLNMTRVAKGQAGLSARLIQGYAPTDIYGGDISCVLAVDPEAQNYVTIKTWGSDGTSQNTELNFEGYRSGCVAGTGLKGSFYYATCEVPLALTRGKSSIHVKLTHMGRRFAYQRWDYSGYQRNTQGESIPLYALYAHDTAAFAPPVGDPVVPPPLSAARRKLDVAATVKANKAANDNSWTGLLQSNNALSGWDMRWLVAGYFEPWSKVHGDPAVPTRLLSDVDNQIKLYYNDPGKLPLDWGGTIKHSSYVVNAMYDDFKAHLNEVVDFGAGGQVPRHQGWAGAIAANLDGARTHRLQITNQSMSTDDAIVYSNLALQKIEPQNSHILPRDRWLSYLHQDTGMEPWRGSDLADGSSEWPFGHDYYMVTPRGSRESRAGLARITAT